MMTLFQAVTADTLPDLIFAGMDATGVDQPPVPTDWSWTALYFLLWLLVGNFMALNLFVGAIVDNFQTTRRETDDWALLTPEQQQWVRMVKSLPSTRPIRPPAPPTVLRWLRAPLYQLALSERWQSFMLFMLVININQLALDYHGIEKHPIVHDTWVLVADFFFYFYWAEFAVKVPPAAPPTHSDRCATAIISPSGALVVGLPNAPVA
jgi:hypothetical protein